jgi:alkylation response protein AidB-like acyl-CoA dehydrogenase
MDLTFGAEYEAFRREARSWLAGHIPSEPLPSLQTAAGFDAHRAWEATMFADRWSAVSWPVEYGGRGLGVMEWLVFEEEYHQARAPERVSQNGISLLGPRLFEYGTAAQRDRFLLPMAAGEEIWCESWPAPEAGGDLVAVSSGAVRNPKGDSWILSGQKAWTSGGTFAHWCFGVFLTDPGAGRDRGWTYFLIAMDAPGVTMRPIRQVDGGAGLAEIFLENVEVPDIQVLGHEGSGWSIALSDPGNQQAFGLRSPARSSEAAARLIDLFDQRGAPTTAADAVAHAYIDAQALALHTYWTASKIALGQAAGPEASCNKIFLSETSRAIHETAMALLGSDAEVLEAGSPGEWLHRYPGAISGPLNAVTNEMQCNFVAEQLLRPPNS